MSTQSKSRVFCGLRGIYRVILRAWRERVSKAAVRKATCEQIAAYFDALGHDAAAAGDPVEADEYWTAAILMRTRASRKGDAK